MTPNVALVVAVAVAVAVALLVDRLGGVCTSMFRVCNTVPISILSSAASAGSDAGTDVDHCASCLPADRAAAGGSAAGGAISVEALDELYGSLESGAAALKLVTVVQAVISCLTLCKLRGLCPSPALDTSVSGLLDWWTDKLGSFRCLLDLESEVFEGHFVLLSDLTHEYLQGLPAVDF
eukprot:COSAG06_NODE_10372_length_1693_cov_1.566499_2_plen_178_part_01